MLVVLFLSKSNYFRFLYLFIMKKLAELVAFFFQDQVEKVLYQMLKKMILMLLLRVKTTLIKLFCVLKAYSSRSDSKGVL